MDKLKKVLALVLIAAVAIGLAGCKKKSEQPVEPPKDAAPADHPESEHPTEEDAPSEHPEHPK